MIDIQEHFYRDDPDIGLQDIKTHLVNGPSIPWARKAIRLAEGDEDITGEAKPANGG
jgi:hypothetical protein